VNADSAGMLIAVWIPLLVVWGVVMVDVIGRTDIGFASKAIWAIACTLLWPAMLLYLLLRPTRGRLEDPEDRDDPQARLVNAALRHEAGEITDQEMDTVTRELRRR
jgi:hypothetical protein